MLEDLPDDAGLVKRALRKAGIAAEVKQVDERSEYEKALISFNPQVILSDHALPAFNSIEALEIKLKIAPEVPFILVTGAVSEEFAAQCIRQGADDYVLKTNLTRLPVAISNAIDTKKMQQKSVSDMHAIARQNEELTKVNDEMDAFIYSLSHGLRSPLSSILGLVNLARMESEDQLKAKNYLEMIETSVKKLDLTIKEMLDYSRNARQEVGHSELNLRELIDHSFATLEYIKGFHQVSKKIVVDQPIAFVGDSYRLSTVISCLLSNALKFADHTKPDPYVSINATVNDDALEIKVEDNGIGIKKEFKPHVFKMFYRGTDKVDGAGLGLFVALEVTAKLGAELKLESSEGVGTKVIFRMPNQPDHGE